MPLSKKESNENKGPSFMEGSELSASIKHLEIMQNLKIGNIDDYYRCPTCFKIPQLYLSYDENDNEKQINAKIKIKCEKNDENHDENCLNMYMDEFLGENGCKFNIFESNCQNCGENYKSLNISKFEFIYCYECEYFFCPNCHENHKNEHKKYSTLNKFDYICEKHLENITHFCPICFKNLCNKCKEDDENHNNKIIPINIINFEKYENNLIKAKIYRDTISDIIVNYIKQIQKEVEILRDNFENFKNLNNQEIQICDTLIEFAKKNLKNNQLNYFIIQNVTTILNFNNLNINQLTENLSKKDNLENKLMYMNTFLTNNNNLILKNSKKNCSLEDVQIKYENNDFKYYILNGIQLLDGRIALGLTNRNINIYNKLLKIDFSIQLPENENPYSLFQLSNHEILIGTNFGNIISYFIRKNEYIEHINMNISDLRIFKILQHPDNKKIIICIENGEIKIFNIETSNYYIEEKLSFDSHHSIVNAIINNNKLITLSKEEQEIRIWEYENDSKRFKCIQNSIKVPIADWFENVCNVDENRIIVLGNSQINLINIKDFQIVNTLQLNSEYICICNLIDNSFLIGATKTISQISINDNNFSLGSSKEISNIEGDLITNIFDAGNMGIIVTSSRGIIKILDF